MGNLFIISYGSLDQSVSNIDSFLIKETNTIWAEFESLSNLGITSLTILFLPHSGRRGRINNKV